MKRFLQDKYVGSRQVKKEYNIDSVGRKGNKNEQSNIRMRYRFHGSVISNAIWLYVRFNNSYRDVAEQLAYRGIIVSQETIRSWEVKFGELFKNIIRKKSISPSDKWHLDEVRLKIKGEYYVLWRAVDSNGLELDVFL